MAGLIVGVWHVSLFLNGASHGVAKTAGSVLKWEILQTSSPIEVYSHRLGISLSYLGHALGFDAIGEGAFFFRFGWAALFVLGAAQQASAALEPVVAEAEFVTPILIVENNALQFGLLDVNLANLETIVIGTDDAVTDAASRVLGGSQAAADLTITASVGYTITILVDNINSGTGYDLDTFFCSYDGGADTACDGGGYTATSVASGSMDVGATMTGDGTAVAGNADGSFNITINYQ